MQAGVPGLGSPPRPPHPQETLLTSYKEAAELLCTFYIRKRGKKEKKKNFATN